MFGEQVLGCCLSFRHGKNLPRSSKNQIGSVDPDALKIPARRAECSLTENARSPFHAEPGQLHDGCRAWKSFDWQAMTRLHEKGLIEDPVNKAKSVVLTEKGLAEAERLFKALFVKE